MFDQNDSFSALLGSRLCHDLISPIGAINNGMELLEMSGNLHGPEMDLISESVRNASARIRFFRIAFGVAGDQMVGRAEVTSVLTDLYGDSRLDLKWMPQHPHPRTAIRLVFLGVLCLETAMPYGGQADLQENDGRWTLKGYADKLNINNELWCSFNLEEREEIDLTPAQIQFGLLPKCAQQVGRRVTARWDDHTIALTF